MKPLFLALFAVLVSFGLFAQEEEDVNASVATVKDIFREEYKNLKTPEDRKALAKKLLEQAADPTNTPVIVYALIMECAKLAGEAGDIATIAEASKLYAEKFAGNAIATRKKMLEAAEKAALKPSPEALSLLAEEYLKLADDAIAADDYTTATAVSTNAERIATKAKNKELAAKANGKKKEVTAALNSLKNVSTSIDTLKANPEDPDANLAVGKYVCFSKGDWDKGLPMLSKCSDKDYKEAAELELAATDTASTMKSADKWWDIADKEKLKPSKLAIKAHAAALYEKVLPELSGIEKVKVEKRMKEAETAGTPKSVTDSTVYSFNNNSDLRGFTLVGDVTINSKGGLELNGFTQRNHGISTARAYAISKKKFKYPITVEITVHLMPDAILDLFPAIFADEETRGLSFLGGNCNNTNTQINCFDQRVSIQHITLKANKKYCIVLSIDKARNASVEFDGQILFKQKLENNLILEGPIILSGGVGHVVYDKVIVNVKKTP